MIEASESIRRALVARFGPAWIAKTTEEFTSEPDLAAQLGPERTGPLLAVLREADRLKFSDASATRSPQLAPQSLSELLAKVPELVGALTPEAGEMSRIKGR